MEEAKRKTNEISEVVKCQHERIEENHKHNIKKKRLREKIIESPSSPQLHYSARSGVSGHMVSSSSHPHHKHHKDNRTRRRDVDNRIRVQEEGKKEKEKEKRERRE